MSKKRRTLPLRHSTSKNLARVSSSRQNGFSSSLAAMWFGTTSRITPEPRLAERAKALLASEVIRDARRVDDVVAVGRAGARL